MTNYYPYTNRKSLLETCLLTAFRQEWQNQEKEVKAKIVSQEQGEITSPFAFTAFNLQQANQTFNIGESDLFTETTLLFKKMHDLQPESMRKHDSDNSYRLNIRGNSVQTSDFSIAQIGDKMSYVDAIKFLHSLYISQPELIYGALLHDGKNFINPLHHINAQAIAKKIANDDASILNMPEYILPNYKLMLYTHSNGSYKNYNSFFNDEKLEPLFVNQILSTCALLDVKSTFTFKITGYTSLSELAGGVLRHYNEISHWKEFKYNYAQVNTSKSSTPVSDIHIQPIQLVNTGIALPYYGIAAQKYSSRNGTIGYNLSPMMSCNIGEHETKVENNGSITVHGANVCTGNFSNESIGGKLSLNHANLGSPYYRGIVSYGSYLFAHLSMKISLGIYAEMLDLEKINFLPAPEEYIPISFEEYKRMNPTLSLKDYVTEIKAKTRIKE